MSNKVSDYPYSSALEYPGTRHEDNYMLVGGEEIIDLPSSPLEAFEEIDTLLEARGLPQLSERIPVLAFGRNASPSGAVTKAEKYSHGSIDAQSLATIPMLKGTLADHDVVWHGRPSQGSGYFAELLKSDESEGTDVEVWVQFLTTEQLAAVHTSEGITYEFTEVPQVDLGDGIAIDTVGYTARDASVLLNEDGKPIATAGIERTGSDLEVKDVEGALEHTLGLSAVAAVVGEYESPRDFFDEGQAITKLADKKERQKMVHDALRKSNRSRQYTYDGDGLRYGRAEFDTLPRGVESQHTHPSVINLMESHIAAIRPSAEASQEKLAEIQRKFPGKSDEEYARRVRVAIDPAELIRKREHDTLLDERREARLAQIVSQATTKSSDRHV